MKTHHQLLGINHHASAAQIRDAYRDAVEALDLEQQYTSYDELKVRRLILREAYEALSAPARHQGSRAAQPPRRSALHRALQRRIASRSIVWLLMIGALIAVVSAYLGAQQVTTAVPDAPENTPAAGPAQAAAPSAGSAHAARLQASRKAHMQRKLLAEKLRVQQMQREAMLQPSAQSADEAQPSGSDVDNGVHPARQSMRRWPD